MNSEITLEINSYKHNILRYEYGFYRNIDCKGRPTTGILGGNIYVEMESDSRCFRYSSWFYFFRCINNYLYSISGAVINDT